MAENAESTDPDYSFQPQPTMSRARRDRFLEDASMASSRPSRFGPGFFAAFIAALLVTGAFSMFSSRPADATVVQVYKTPTCGC